MEKARNIIGLLYFIATVSTIGAANSNDRIYNGGLAEIKDYPYLVSVEAPNENGDPTHSCGGFIYSATYVVTAASCVQARNESNIAVIIGTSDLTNFNGDAQRIEVQKIIPYDLYNPANASRTHDIALLQLKRPIILNPTIFAEIIYYGEAIDLNPADIAGWGAVRNEGLPTVVLRSTKVVVVNDDDTTQNGCKTFENYNRNYMMCAQPEPSLGTPVGSPCQFDEGSPLVQATPDGKKIVVGILSRVRVCDTEPPAVYTRIVSYYSWLNKYAGQQS